MVTESNHRDDRLGTHDSPSMTITVPVPARNADLYRYEMTDELLQFLINSPFQEYTYRKLASIFDVTHKTVGKAVEVLEENGIVNIREEGNKHLVRINRERVNAPDNPILQIPQPEFHEPVRRAVVELRNELEDVHGILVYGSVARGHADRQSDVDLWILVGENRGRNQRRATEVGRELSDQQINGERYEFHIVVESHHSIPAHTEDIAKIVSSGTPVYRTEEFEKFQSVMEDMVDE